jgi:GNAT superfamily N-acetyltransferase
VDRITVKTPNTSDLMIKRTPFDEAFLGVACYHLVPPIEPSDLAALSAAREEGPIFASAKIDASDGETAKTLGQLGFRRICTQMLLRGRLDSASQGAGDVLITERLDLDPVDVRAHAAQLDGGRFRQDPLIATDAAIDLYAAWVRNSTSGAKRVASINRNFVSFEDRAGVRWIDLVSVLDKRQGIAVKILAATIEDARRSRLKEVKVVTGSDNIHALGAYRKAGFELEHSLMIFHLLSPIRKIG